MFIISYIDADLYGDSESGLKSTKKTKIQKVRGEKPLLFPLLLGKSVILCVFSE